MTTRMPTIGDTVTRKTIPRMSARMLPIPNSAWRVTGTLRAISRPRLAMSFGNWSIRPPGALSSTWSSPAPKTTSSRFGSTPHSVWKR